MKQTLFTFMFIISLVLMTACGGSPVDKALAKLDDAIEKLEKKGDKMTKDEMDAIMKDLEEPVSVLNKTIEDNEVGGVTKIKIIAKVTKLTALATKVGIKIWIWEISRIRRKELRKSKVVWEIF